MLSPRDIERFVADGFVVVRSAVPRRVIDQCWSEIADQLRRLGTDPGDRSTWTAPVVRLDCPYTAPFLAAGAQARLHEAYDQLLGVGAWAPHPGVGGSVPVRFPVGGDPGDAGWHVDASFSIDGRYGLNVHSRGRGLLCLFLLTDVGPDDAPTEIKVGSHLDVPAVLEPFGEGGTDFITLAESLPSSTFDRRSVFATGVAGDVFVCHPFLVHRATWPHRGDRPRAIAQPAIVTRQPFALDRTADLGTLAPVERAIVEALEQSRPAA